VHLPGENSRKASKFKTIPVDAFSTKARVIGKNCTGKNPLIAAAIISGHQN